MRFSVMSSCHQGSNRTQTCDMILITCCVPIFSSYIPFITYITILTTENTVPLSTLQYCCITTYYITTLLHNYLTTLLPYYITSLLHYCITSLLHYCIAAFSTSDIRYQGSKKAMTM